jgi:hypothetical protein
MRPIVVGVVGAPIVGDDADGSRFTLFAHVGFAVATQGTERNRGRAAEKRSAVPVETRFVRFAIRVANAHRADA